MNNTANSNHNTYIKHEVMSMNDNNNYPEFPLLDLEKCFSTPAPPLDMVLPGLLNGTVGSIVAPGATGKSWLALELAANLAAGVDLLGFGKQKQGRTLILTAEDPPDVLWQRLSALGEKLNVKEIEDVIKNTSISPTLGMRGNDFLNGNMSERLVRLAGNLGGGFRLIMIDTLSQFFSGEVNDRKDAAACMREFEYVAQKLNCALIFTNHVSKSAAVLGEVGNQQSSKGSGVWVDEARWVAFMQTCTSDEAKKVLYVEEEMRKNFVRFGLSKANYIASQPDIWLKRGIGGVLEAANVDLIAKPKTYPQVKNGDDYDRF